MFLALLLSLVIFDWSRAQRDYIDRHPACEACGARDDLAVHHIKPRDDGGSDDPSNLITLCDPHHKGEDRTLGCHWIIGHGASSFDRGNPFARKQAAAILKREKSKELKR